MIGNEDSIRAEVEEKVKEDIDRLQNQIHECDRKILKRKEEIDITDSEIDTFVERKVEKKQKQYEL